MSCLQRQVDRPGDWSVADLCQTVRGGSQPDNGHHKKSNNVTTIIQLSALVCISSAMPCKLLLWCFVWCHEAGKDEFRVYSQTVSLKCKRRCWIVTWREISKLQVSLRFSVTFVLRWLQPLDEPTCVQRRVAILWSLEHEQNWANGVSVYLHRRCGTRSLIRSSILLQAANIFGKNWKLSCLGKPTHQPLRTIEEWTYLLTYLLTKKK